MRCYIPIGVIIALCELVLTTAAASGFDKIEQAEFSPDTIIVKLKEGISVNLDDFAKLSGTDLQNMSPFNRIHQNARAIWIRPLFRDFKRNQRHAKALLNSGKFASNRKEKHLWRRLLRAPQNVAVPDLSRIYRIKVDLEKDESIQEILTAYQSNPYVEYAEPDYYIRSYLIPNDPNYPQQWALSKIAAPEAWDIHTGNHDVLIAVIDTGIDLTHPDLQGNIWINESELNGRPCVDDDQNGYIDDIHGYDFAYDDGEPLDDYSHGSHIAGIIAACGNNGTDVCGICWNASIMAVKAKDPDTLGPISGISEGIYYAVSNGADILSCSWGMNPPSNLLYEAFQYAYSQGVIAVAAAGNSSSSSISYPAGYETVISVGASTISDTRASFSNYGDWVDIMAPGVDIFSLSYYGMTRTWQGTSMACPHVSGACALMLSVNPYLTPDEVRENIMTTGDPIQSGICRSNARVNLFKAILSVVSSTGSVHFDKDFCGCDSTLWVSVADTDLEGTANCEVVLTTDRDEVETLTLKEKIPAIGVFQGSISTCIGTSVIEDGALQVSDGDIITVTYLDEHGSGRYKNTELTYTDTVTVDGQAPTVSRVIIDASSPRPTVGFETDEPTTAVVLYSVAGGQEILYSARSLHIYSTNHNIILNEMSPRTDYTFVIEATDRAGNTTCSDSEGVFYGFTTIADPGHVYVPGDFSTIQAAIDHCWDAGTVWVADGTYTGPGNRDIDFKGKAITIRSESGAEACIIDCGGSQDEFHRGFYFHHRETPDSILDGFTITGGFQEGDSSNGTICRGGGILCNAGSPTIKNCIFRANSATFGGGLHVYNNSNVTLENCVFSDNWAQRGAGINNDQCIINVKDCIFIHNTAGSYYGGLYSGWQDGQSLLARCIFRENSAYYGAGALGVYGNNMTITDCEFVGNTAIGRDSSSGGAVRISNSNVSIQNCIFSGNKSSESGGGLYQYKGHVNLTNCTFVANVAQQGQAAACLAYGDELTVMQAVNCIFWDEGNELFKDESAEFDVRYCDIQGGFNGEGNIDDDPCFVDSGYWDGLDTPRTALDDFWINGDYHLLSKAGYWSPESRSWIEAIVSSPCIDAGDPNSPIGREPAPNGGRINMGAYGGTDQASLSSM